MNASRLLGVNALDGSLFHWAIVRGTEAVVVVVVGGGYLYVFVWVVGYCLAVSGLEVLVEIDVLEIVCNFVHRGKSGLCLLLANSRTEEG